MPQGTLHWPKLTNQCEHPPVHPDSLVSQETGPVRIVLYSHQYCLSFHQRTEIWRVLRRYSGGEKVRAHFSEFMQDKNKRRAQVKPDSRHNSKRKTQTHQK